jgi:hypothetical protein
MLGKVTVIQEDKKAVFIEFDEPAKFKMGDLVNVAGKRKTRTLAQNAFYWCFLSWCIHSRGGDLQNQGHFSTDALHEDVKAWFKATHAYDFNIDKRFTTTELNTKEFTDFFEIVNKELMIEFFGIDTSMFWVEYEKYSKWTEYNSDDFKAFMNEKVSPTPF